MAPKRREGSAREKAEEGSQDTEEEQLLERLRTWLDKEHGAAPPSFLARVTLSEPEPKPTRVIHHCPHRSTHPVKWYPRKLYADVKLPEGWSAKVTGSGSRPGVSDGGRHKRPVRAAPTVSLFDVTVLYLHCFFSLALKSVLYIREDPVFLVHKSYFFTEICHYPRNHPLFFSISG
jgi:hypothetical protein